jgi:hypothetical protein
MHLSYGELRDFANHDRTTTSTITEHEAADKADIKQLEPISTRVSSMVPSEGGKAERQ